jgi:hypothetical protein
MSDKSSNELGTIPESDVDPFASGRDVLLRLRKLLFSRQWIANSLYAICLLIILLKPLVPHTRIMLGSLSLATFLAVGLFALLAVLHESTKETLDEWFLLAGSYRELYRKMLGVSLVDHRTKLTQDQAALIAAPVNKLARNDYLLRALSVLLCTGTVSLALDTAVTCYRAGGPAWSVCLAVLASSIPPAVSIIALWCSQRRRSRTEFFHHHQTTSNQQEINTPETGTKVQPGTGTALAKSMHGFLLTRGPYLGAYCGFLTFTTLAVFLPRGVGHGFAGWLHASMRDANIAGPGYSSTFALVVSSIVALFIFNAGNRLAMRLSASFQIFINRVLVNRENVLDALIETATTRSTALVLPEKNIGARNILSIITWLGFCYAMLFSLVAFCPPPLGDTILDWLTSCLRDAHIDIDPHQHANLRLFLASVCAGYGAAPMAAMSCVFLSNRKHKSLIISSQGILCPGSASNLLGFSPLKLWSDLKAVKVESRKEGQTLILAFKWGDKVKIDVKNTNPTNLNELLAAADEYAAECKFEPEAIDLRLKLRDEAKTTSLIEADKFVSSVFSPHKGGDKLNGGKYRVVRKLAGKALSTVYLARDENDQHVVIKEFVLPSLAKQRERLILNFEREFSLLSGIRHDAIANVKQMFQESDARYIVMEYVRGSDLRTIVERKGSRNEKVVKKWAEQIAQIMLYLHQRDPVVLHRDLTPDNLMEDSDGQIKLIDFGAAHQFMEGVTGTLIGKQCYIAPEQLRGKPSVRSDVYSFGGTLFYLLTGRDPAALKQCDLSGDPSVSRKIAGIIMKCTEFDERDRYQSFEEIIKDLYDDEQSNGKVLHRQGVPLHE